MAVTHVGHWPFRDETGTGPLATDGNFGQGSGCVITAATPLIATDFPFTVATKQEAMWWFWAVAEWTYDVSTPYVTDSDTLSQLPVYQILEQRQLVTLHNGFAYTLPTSSHGGPFGTMKSLGGGIYIDVYVRVANPVTAGYAQVKFNPNTGLWLPNVCAYVQIFDDGSVTGHEYTLGLTTDPTASAYYGGADRVTANLGDYQIELSGQFDGFGPATVSFSPTLLW